MNPVPFAILYLVLLVETVRALPTGHDNDRFALEWLGNTGWYPSWEPSVDGMSDEDTEKILHKYLPAMQEFYHTGGDGVVNKNTLETMLERNCGNKDHDEEQSESEHGRSKRYAHLGGRWPRGATLTFGFSKYLSGLSISDQINIATGCAKMWGDVSSLKFRLVDPREEFANILITHARIDGPQGTVGRGQSPRSRGSSRITLDESDRWRPTQLSGNRRGSVYQEALCHEMGHTLGLGHSQVRGAIMYHQIGNRDRNTRLHGDDIRGIQSRYGPNTDGRSLIGSSVSTRPQQPDFRPPTSRSSYRTECTFFGCRRVYYPSPSTRRTSIRSRRPSSRRIPQSTRTSISHILDSFGFFR